MNKSKRNPPNSGIIKNDIANIQECLLDIISYLKEAAFDINYSIDPKIIKSTMKKEEALFIKNSVISNITGKLNGPNKLYSGLIKLLEIIEKRIPLIKPFTKECKNDKKLKAFFFLSDKKYDITNKLINNPLLSIFQHTINNILITITKTNLKKLIKPINKINKTNKFIYPFYSKYLSFKDITLPNKFSI